LECEEAEDEEDEEEEPEQLFRRYLAYSLSC